MQGARGLEKKAEAARKAAMAAFACATREELEQLSGAAGIAMQAETLRGPETGLTTVRGRIGGGGAVFNIGETTVTRATVRLASGEIGHAYALGRDKEQVRLAAILDAHWCADATRGVVEARIVAPILERLAAADAVRQAETAATKVDFFTMVRGED